jgi:7,8-dihydropterin-6-yl-methyl-4-(beta-D-ribofuranosyl)aminobenzene 5'-phosphate synthase
MLEAIRMINKAKQDCGHTGDKVIVDVHPSRPDYRGFQFGEKLISLEADPTIDEIQDNGAQASQNYETHTVLDDMFLISGEIPRQTSYETGLKFGMRFDKSEGEWYSDEKVADERFLMCNLKGSYLPQQPLNFSDSHIPSRQRISDVYGLQPRWSCQCISPCK